MVTFKTTPYCALLLKASHRHSASAFSTVFSPVQHVPSGFDAVLPFDTYDRQSAMFSTRLEQSTAGEGDVCCDPASTQQIPTTNSIITTLNIVFIFITIPADWILMVAVGVAGMV